MKNLIKSIVVVASFTLVSCGHVNSKSSPRKVAAQEPMPWSQMSDMDKPWPATMARPSVCIFTLVEVNFTDVKSWNYTCNNTLQQKGWIERSDSNKDFESIFYYANTQFKKRGLRLRHIDINDRPKTAKSSAEKTYKMYFSAQ